MSKDLAMSLAEIMNNDAQEKEFTNLKTLHEMGNYIKSKVKGSEFTEEDLKEFAKSSTLFIKYNNNKSNDIYFEDAKNISKNANSNINNKLKKYTAAVLAAISAISAASININNNHTPRPNENLIVQCEHNINNNINNNIQNNEKNIINK
ncbi:MAG: hypothetical protein NkDv07_0349 [Candidatus Improbicoccus devescovinae]|nr:MAG: hypothetical protein NkDv07_0349 [Candidatus Improbicoccus devescovinae]